MMQLSIGYDPLDYAIKTNSGCIAIGLAAYIKLTGIANPNTMILRFSCC